MLPQTVDYLRDVRFEISRTTANRIVGLKTFEGLSAAFELFGYASFQEFESFDDDLSAKRRDG